MSNILTKDFYQTAIELLTLEANGSYPNNPLPVIIYRNILGTYGPHEISILQKLLNQHAWVHSWINGISGEHHFHSSAHELLVLLSGATQLELGGPGGVHVIVNPDDAIVIPAGVSHKNLIQKNTIQVLGVYPRGQQYDMRYGRSDEIETVTRNIKETALPTHDPFFGTNGPLRQAWCGRVDK